MSSQEENYVTAILSPLAFITGYLGLNLVDIDLIFAIGLKALSMVSVVLICLVNWKKGIQQLKEWFKWK